LLTGEEALRLFAALCAAHRGMEGLPEPLRSRGGRDPDLMALGSALFELASRGLLLPVVAEPRAEDASSPAADNLTSTPPPRPKDAAFQASP
ncbi:MAG: hypothetical protein N3A66_08045, partial [Planctomycetota bacterium]|nr:hypothetical protein [Planctomycetota bacterium]